MFFDALQGFPSLFTANQTSPGVMSSVAGMGDTKEFASLLAGNMQAVEGESPDISPAQPIPLDEQTAGVFLEMNGGSIVRIEPATVEKLQARDDIKKLKVELEMIGADGEPVILPVTLFVIDNTAQGENENIAVMVVFDTEALDAASHEQADVLFDAANNEIPVTGNGVEHSGKVVEAGKVPIPEEMEYMPESARAMVLADDTGYVQPALARSESDAASIPDDTPQGMVWNTGDMDGREEGEIVRSNQEQMSVNKPSETQQPIPFQSAGEHKQTETLPRIVIRPEPSAAVTNAEAAESIPTENALASLIQDLVPEGQTVEIVYAVAGDGMEKTGDIPEMSVSAKNALLAVPVSDEGKTIVLGNHTYRRIQTLSAVEQEAVPTPLPAVDPVPEKVMRSDIGNGATNSANSKIVVTGESSQELPQTVIDGKSAAASVETAEVPKQTASNEQSVKITAGTDIDQSPSVSVPETGNISPSRSVKIIEPETAGSFERPAASAMASVSSSGQDLSEVNESGTDVERARGTGADTEIASGTSLSRESRAGGEAEKPVGQDTVGGTGKQVPVENAKSQGYSTSGDTVNTEYETASTSGQSETGSQVREKGMIDAYKSEIQSVDQQKGGMTEGNDMLAESGRTVSSERSVDISNAGSAEKSSGTGVKSAGVSESANQGNNPVQGTDSVLASEVSEMAVPADDGYSRSGDFGSVRNSSMQASENTVYQGTAGMQVDTEPGIVANEQILEKQATAVSSEAATERGTMQAKPEAARQTASSTGAEHTDVDGTSAEKSMNPGQRVTDVRVGQNEQPDGYSEPRVSEKSPGPAAIQTNNEPELQSADTEILPEKIVQNSKQQHHMAVKDRPAGNQLAESGNDIVPSGPAQTVLVAGTGSMGPQGNGLSFGTDNPEQFAGLMTAGDDSAPDELPAGTEDSGGRAFAVIDSMETREKSITTVREAGFTRAPYHMETVDDGHLVQSIVRGAVMMTKNGRSSAVITLDPPSLGKMQLDIVTERSTVTGKITVESAEVRDMVQNNMAELREHLAQNGLKVESFDVQVGHNGGTDSWARNETFRMAGQNMNNAGSRRQNTYAAGTMSAETNAAPVRGRAQYTRSIDVMI